MFIKISTYLFLGEIKHNIDKIKQEGNDKIRNINRILGGGLKKMYKQYIIIRKDLPMSAGKLVSQGAHASESFLTHMISKSIILTEEGYVCNMVIDKDLWEQWMNPEASFTKVTLGIKNRNQLEKLLAKANEMGFVEGKDYFCIHDEARTELQDYKEEDGRVLTAIGFIPMEEEKLRPLLGKLQLFK